MRRLLRQKTAPINATRPEGRPTSGPLCRFWQQDQQCLSYPHHQTPSSRAASLTPERLMSGVVMSRQQSYANGQAQKDGLPRNEAAERCVLGGMLKDNATIGEVVPIVGKQDFYFDAHQRIFAAILSLYKANRPIDTVSLGQHLLDAGHFDDVGGAAYLLELPDACPSPASVEYHAGIVRQIARRRELIRSTQSLLDGARNPTMPVEDLLDNYRRQLSELETTGPDRKRVQFPRPIPSSQLRRCNYTESAILDGFLYRGRISLFWSLPKTGKTTVMAGLLRAMDKSNTSETFIGQRVRHGKVLYVSEENEEDWGNRCDRFGIGDHVEHLPRPIPNTDTHPRVIWCDLVEYLDELAATEQYDLVVIDTLSAFWGIDDENAAPHVIAALNHLNHRFRNSALHLVHHSRKSGGEEGTGARGSGALMAFVDIGIELRRVCAGNPKDRRRSLIVNSRIPDAPPETIIELQPDNTLSVVNKAESGHLRILTPAIRLFPDDDSFVTADDLIAVWTEKPKPKKFDLQAAMRFGQERGVVRIEGKGKPRDPFKYQIVSKTPFEGEENP